MKCCSSRLLVVPDQNRYPPTVRLVRSLATTRRWQKKRERMVRVTASASASVVALSSRRFPPVHRCRLDSFVHDPVQFGPGGRLRRWTAVHSAAHCSCSVCRCQSKHSLWSVRTVGQATADIDCTFASSCQTKAVKIYGRLLDVVVTQSVMEQTGMPPQSLLSYQTAGNPIAALLSCLESGEANLQFGALSCLGRLLASDCDGRLLAEFLSKGGYPHVLGFGQHAEYRFHTLVLGILDTLSRNGEFDDRDSRPH